MDGEGRWNYGWKRLDGVGKDRWKKVRRGDLVFLDREMEEARKYRKKEEESDERGKRKK